MLILEWWLPLRFGCGVLIVVLAGVTLWGVRGRRPLLRLPAQIVSVPVGILGGLFALLTLGMAGCQSYSAPAYSPGGVRAVRIRNSDRGGLGGSTDVEIFAAHSLRRDDVFQGGWKSVEAAGVRWVSDSELEILYTGRPYQCVSTNEVKVRCDPK